MSKKKEENNYSKLLSQVSVAYNEARQELDTRITHKVQGYDEYDNLYRSYIDPTKWPYSAKIFVPLSFTSLFNKGSRLITNKLKGKLVADDYEGELAAKIGTELLMAQYEEHDFHFGESLNAKWLRVDQNTRKYGAGFALVGWKKEKVGSYSYDGPTFEPLDNRKVYLQPAVKNEADWDYVIVERTLTLEQMMKANEAKNVEVFKNLDKLKNVSENTVDEKNPSRNSILRGLDDKRSGKGLKTPFRVLTYYSRDQFITWTPDVGDDKDNPEGTILRVTQNPYPHGLIPIIRLVYIPIDDDIVGMSELEAGRSQQKALNALVSGFIDSVSLELYPILKGHPTNVDWATVEFKPKAAWLMQNPQADLERLEGAFGFTQKFVEAYRLLASQFAESMGDTTSDASNMASLSSDKTATEVRDTALKRGARDNLNKLFLSAAITRMYKMWWEMDKVFLTQEKIINVSGKEAIKYFVEQGLSDYTLDDKGYQYIYEYIRDNQAIGVNMNFDMAYERLRELGELEQFAKPMFATSQGLPKLTMKEGTNSGYLTVAPEDLVGNHKFVFDLNTFSETNTQEEAQNLIGYLDRAAQYQEQLASDGFKIKYKDLLEDIGEKLNLRNADQYFEAIEESPEDQIQSGEMGIPQEGLENAVQQGGAGGIPLPDQAVLGQQGVQGVPIANANAIPQF